MGIVRRVCLAERIMDCLYWSIGELKMRAVTPSRMAELLGLHVNTVSSILLRLYKDKRILRHTDRNGIKHYYVPYHEAVTGCMIIKERTEQQA